MKNDLEDLIKFACKAGSYYGVGPFADMEPSQTKENRDRWKAIAKALMAYDVLLKKEALGK